MPVKNFPAQIVAILEEEEFKSYLSWEQLTKIVNSIAREKRRRSKNQL